MAHVNTSVAVEAEWDDDAGVWVATSRDVPGLVVEHSDFRTLQAMVVELIPALLIENDLLPQPRVAQDIPVHFAAQALAGPMRSSPPEWQIIVERCSPCLRITAAPSFGTPAGATISGRADQRTPLRGSA